MPRGNGGVLGPANIPTTTVAKGVWSLMEQQLAQRQGIWPIVLPSDPYFEYTTLLLPGNGTNGAQNNTFLDGSTNNFTITRNGNTTQGTFSPFSQTGWGAYFDGASDYIQFTNSDFSVSTGDFTAEWWMFVTSDKSQVGVMTAASNANLTIGYGSGSANARQVYVEWGGSGAYIGSMSNYANSWVHICVMRSSGTVYTFQNGTLLSSASKSAALGSTANMVIGTNSGDIAAQSFPGYLSNVRFSKVAVYSTSGFTPSTSPLTRTSQGATDVQFLTLQSNRFLDSNGVNTPASSPLTIAKNGDTSVVAFSPFNPSASWSAATYGGSGYFDGNGDYLTVANTAALQLSNSIAWTIETWFYATTVSVEQQIFNGYSQSPSYPGWGIALGTGGAASTTLRFWDGTSWRDIASGISAGQWYHVAVAYDGSGTTGRLYLNGNQQGSSFAPASTINNTSTAIGIGAPYNGASPFSGYISGARVVKGTAVYTGSTYTVPTAPLTAITNTSLLLNFTNAGIYDATSKNDLETVGNAQISTAVNNPFGQNTGVMAFDGTGDYLTNNNYNSVVLPFGSGDFTLEGWVYTSSSANMGICQISTTSGGLQASQTNTVALYIFNYVFGAYYANAAKNGGTSISSSTWSHFALVRSSGTLKLYVNGTADSTFGSLSDTTNYTGGYIAIGGYYNASYLLNGYLQDFRITRYARYTTNFTAPTAAFPTL